MTPRPTRAVPNYGLTHIAVAVKDLHRTAAFYGAVVGAVIVYRGENFLQLQTPGARDVMAFEHKPRLAGKHAGVMHFGFRLKRARDIERAREAARVAGGVITETGDFVPGEPYLFCRDPDGYMVEIWYELPTPVDPKPRRKPRQTAARNTRR